MAPNSKTMTRTTSLVAATSLAAFAIAAAALALPPDPQFIPHTPDTTGMPGQGTVMFARFAPDGKLWVSSNTAGQIWLFGGIGVYDRVADTWTTHSSRNTPLQFWNYSVAWDAQGDAWIACENQLVKFDGQNWTTFGPGDSPLVGDRNWAVAIAPNGNVWVANDDIDQVQGGLFEYDPTTNQWTHHDEPWMRTYFGISAPFTVYARSNGQVWAAFEFMNGNARYGNGAWVHQAWPLLLGFAEDSQGVLYATGGADTPGVFRYNDATQTWSQIGPYNSDVIAIDAQDRIYVPSGSNVYRFANGAWTVFAEAPNETQSVDFDADGDVWITYRHSVRQYAPDGTGKHIYSSVITGIGEYIIDNIELDNEGNLWTMASITGASRFDGERYRNFSQYGHEETNPFQVGSSLLCTNVEDVFQDSAGNIWFAANGVARSADLESWDFWYWGNANLPYDHLTAIGQDANGDIWAGSNGSGIYRFDEPSGQWIYRSLGTSYSANRVREIVTATDGVMWVITYAGVHRFDGANWTFIPAWSAEIPSMPLDIAAGLSGEVWIATGDGLVRHDGANWQVYGPHNAPFMHSKISCVAVRGDGLVAACSEDTYNWPYSGDLCLFDGTQWAQYPGGYGNPNPFYQAMAAEFDRDGHLWLAQVNYGGVQVLLGAPTPGDLDGDGDVDLDDWALFAECMTGPEGGTGAGCESSDVAADGDVDLRDFAVLQELFQHTSP